MTGGVIAGLIVGGAIGYVAKPTVAAPPTTVTSSVTETVRGTVTAPPPPLAKAPVKVDVAFWVGNLSSPYWISCKNGAEAPAKDVNDYFGQELLTATTFDCVDAPAKL